jgi:aerobic-type carbon monoxide dehydrogenase small subunit (CoxS/CutS family)
MTEPPSGQLLRAAESGRPSVSLTIDGVPARALAGDTLLTAILTRHGHLRQSEFGDGPRAGFCLMGACQDCWVRLGDGTPVRACSTLVADGMAILTAHPLAHG